MTGAIESPSNDRIKHLVRLRKRRERDQSGVFLIEGYRELSRAVGGSIEIAEVYYSPGHFLGGNEPDLLQQAEAGGATLIEVAEKPFAKASYRDRPEGLLAVARQFPTPLGDLSLSDRPLLLVVEAIEKPGNLGTMLRTGDAAGVDAVIVCDPTTDIFNPNVVRASLGTLFTVQMAVAPSGDAIDWLSLRQIPILASVPSGGRVYTDVDLATAAALVVGSEQLGLSDTFRDRATDLISIPMQGQIDSLNAAISAGILLYEALRQRNA